MATSKDILVITSSSLDGIKVKKYLKPVSAHVVAGTNLFSDFLGGMTDVFGGRSDSYQKQLTSLYNEAIEKVKLASYEIGGNCIIGLSIDMDEISGKGKSMFMVTAIGTAVIIERDESEKFIEKTNEKFENVSVDKVDVLRTKKTIIKKAELDTLNLDETIWEFITVNQIDEVFVFLLKKLISVEGDKFNNGTSEIFYKNFVRYVDSLPEQKKINLVYNSIIEENSKIQNSLSNLIKDLNLFDFNKCMEILKNSDFEVKKIGLKISGFDKQFYNKQDKEDLHKILDYIKENFVELGTRTTKKQMLSSKEKEVWICECGKTNEFTYCSNCLNDIYGFKESDVKPKARISYIENKIELITELMN